MLKAPKFWDNNSGRYALLSSPLCFLYQMVGRIRWKLAKPYCASIPVICVGNVTMGGAGKTPFVILLVEILKSHGKNPCIISRGYGGKLRTNIIVTERHSALEVGDEPKLLSQYAACIIGAGRKKSAKMAENINADIIIMDDGLQNPSLRKDLCFLVIDGGYGFGNGSIFPAGALREKIVTAFLKVQACVLIGKDETAILHQLPRNLPLIRAYMELNYPPKSSPKSVEQKVLAQKMLAQKIIGFCGIARPKKFYDSLRQAGFKICATRDFPDHHYFSEHELQQLHDDAQKHDAILVTTQKDYMRLSTEWQQKVTAIPAKLVTQNMELLTELLYQHNIMSKVL